MKHRPCRLHESCTRPDGHTGACVDVIAELYEYSDQPFSGRVCPSCGWHEAQKRATERECIVCGAGMSPSE